MDFQKNINSECAFHIESKICTPKELIDKLAPLLENLNNFFNKSKNVIVSPQRESDEVIIERLKNHYNCASETCVLTQQEVGEYLNNVNMNTVLKENFKPIGPKNTTRWLSNIDIDNVLTQIAQKYPIETPSAFYHINYQMRDFEAQNTELAQLDFADEYARGYKTFGTVFNTDFSTGPGIHWLAIFGDFRDINAPTIEYFNSSGEPPMREIAIWMKKVKIVWGIKMNTTIEDITVSDIQHQYDNHSCGAYSLYYIMSRLEGTPYDYFSKNKVSDDSMVEFRKFLFRE